MIRQRVGLGYNVKAVATVNLGVDPSTVRRTLRCFYGTQLATFRRNHKLSKKYMTKLEEACEPCSAHCFTHHVPCSGTQEWISTRFVDMHTVSIAWHRCIQRVSNFCACANPKYSVYLQDSPKFLYNCLQWYESAVRMRYCGGTDLPCYMYTYGRLW
jgi:hypothetical protein